MPEIVLRDRARPARDRDPERIGARADERARARGRRSPRSRRRSVAADRDCAFRRRRSSAARVPGGARCSNMLLEKSEPRISRFSLRGTRKPKPGERVGDVLAAVHGGDARDGGVLDRREALCGGGRELANESRRPRARALRRSRARARRAIVSPSRVPVTIHVPSASRSTRSTRTPVSTRPTVRASASVSVCMPLRNEKLRAAFFAVSGLRLRSRAPGSGRG